MAQMINGGIGRMSERIADAVGGSLGAARHAARRAENAAGDLLYSTSRSVKRHPARTLLTGIGMAFAAGIVLGRVMRRR